MRCVKWLGMALFYADRYIGILEAANCIDVADEDSLALVLKCQREAA